MSVVSLLYWSGWAVLQCRWWWSGYGKFWWPFWACHAYPVVVTYRWGLWVWLGPGSREEDLMWSMMKPYDPDTADETPFRSAH